MKKLFIIMLLALITTLNIGILCGAEELTELAETKGTDSSAELTLRTIEERRQYDRFNTRALAHPITIVQEEQSGIEGLIDISRGGVGLKHNNTLKEGDIIPIHIIYKDISIHTTVKVIAATETRAGAEYIEHSQSLTNKLLYLSIYLEADNNMLKTKLST